MKTARPEARSVDRSSRFVTRAAAMRRGLASLPRQGARRPSPAQLPTWVDTRRAPNGRCRVPDPSIRRCARVRLSTPVDEPATTTARSSRSTAPPPADARGRRTSACGQSASSSPPLTLGTTNTATPRCWAPRHRSEPAEIARRAQPWVTNCRQNRHATQPDRSGQRAAAERQPESTATRPRSSGPRQAGGVSPSTITRFVVAMLFRSASAGA